MFIETHAVADERQLCGTPSETARLAPEYRLTSCGRHDARRADAEAFIRKRFWRSHSAQVTTFMPTLMLLSDAHDALMAVAGFRCAADEPLFLEQYLPVPIEQAISSRVTAPPERAEIVEVGNFAATDSRHAKRLMSYMPAWFMQRSARWITFTATAAVRGILCAMGGHCIELGAADGARVTGGGDEWGRYYSNDPRVMAGFLPSARRIPALWRTHHGD